MAAQKSGVYPTSGSSRSGMYRLEVAKTDVYDERRRNFLIQYPIGVVIGLGLAGVLAFALTGFLGYNDENEPAFTQVVFGQAWPLFLWFCALIMALQISILRHPSLRRQLTATLVVTLLSMLIVGILYYFKVQFLDLLQRLLQQLLNIRLLLPEISGSKWLYALINFGLILIFHFLEVRRAVLASAVAIPIFAVICSRIAYGDATHFGHFLFVLVGLFLFELYEHFRRHQIWEMLTSKEEVRH